MTTFVTKPSWVLRREQDKAYEARIAAAIVDMEEAKSQGDLSENFGYAEGKKEVERLRMIQSSLGTNDPLQIIDPMDWADQEIEEARARVGVVVKFQIQGSEEVSEVLLGGAWDGDLPTNPGQLQIAAYTSPLGRALIPKPVGTNTETNLGGVKTTLSILGCRAPSKLEIEAIYPDLKLGVETTPKAKGKPAQGQGLEI